MVTADIMLHHTATHLTALQHTATLCSTLQYAVAHCNTLQHTATHCKIFDGHARRRWKSQEGAREHRQRRAISYSTLARKTFAAAPHISRSSSKTYNMSKETYNTYKRDHVCICKSTRMHVACKYPPPHNVSGGGFFFETIGKCA